MACNSHTKPTLAESDTQNRLITQDHKEPNAVTTKQPDLDLAEQFRDELETKLGEALETVNEATEIVGNLKACFDGHEDFKDEYKQADGWQKKLLFTGLSDILAQVSGEEEESQDDDAPVQLLLERKKIDWLKRMVVFVRAIESADFQTDACDEVLADFTVALQ